MRSEKHNAIKNVILVSLTILFLLSLSGLAVGATISITKDDLRDTEAGKLLHQLNEEIRDLKKDWKNPHNSAATKKAISNSAKNIKYGEEYQDAVSQLKPLMGKRISCFGSMCDSPTWKQDAIKKILRNSSHTNCYYNRYGNVKCQRNPPEPDKIYGATPKDVIVGDVSSPGGHYNCPPEYNTYEVPSQPMKPYWGCTLDLGACAAVQCITCNAKGDWSSVSENHCPGNHPRR